MSSRSFASLMARMVALGYPESFVRLAILPDWWSADCDADPQLLPDFEFKVARFLQQPLAEVRDPDVPLRFPPQNPMPTVPLGDGRVLESIGIPEVLYAGEYGSIWAAKIPAVMGERLSYGRNPADAHKALKEDIAAAWRIYVETDPKMLASDGVELADRLRAAFRVAHG